MQLVTKLRDREVSTAEFDAGFQQIIYTKKHASQKTLVQYILRKVALHEGQPFLGDTDDLTIEHLLPQSSSKGDDDELIIGQLGNLLLVDSKTNEMLSTNDFKQKKAILQERGYKLPEMLDEADHLTAELIEENTKRISSAARGIIWKV